MSSNDDPALKTVASVGLQKLAESVFKRKRAPLSDLLLSLNAVFDSVQLEGAVSKTFKDVLQ